MASVAVLCRRRGIPRVVQLAEHESVLMPATVVDGVTSKMGLYRDESFGPIVAVIRARDEAHAIELANDSEYGLSASVFTRDAARGLMVARRVRSGICHVNGPTVHDEAQMPFGGVGASGYGRFGVLVHSSKRHCGSPSRALCACSVRLLIVGPMMAL
jgi:acyl-CoA reductase-like NAD-dependent aldehyde dehydrogenase